MTESNALATQKQTTTLRSYMTSEIVMKRFSDILGDWNAKAYVNSVLIAVASNTTLQSCSQVSILESALRAATLRLSVDPSTGQAHLVPFKGKCTLVLGYKGIYHMAVRTGWYRYINLDKVYAGEEVAYDRKSGLYQVNGYPTDKTVVIGYMLNFASLKGFEKNFYMTWAECMEHGRKYSKNFSSPDSVWQKDPDAMVRKTVIRMGLLKWGYLDPADVQNLKEMDADADQDVVDGEAKEVSDRGVSVETETKPQMTAAPEVSFSEEEPEQPPEEPETPSEDDGIPDIFRSKPVPEDPAFAFDGEKIVTTYASIAGITTKIASQTLHELFKAGKIGKFVTVKEITRIASGG